MFSLLSSDYWNNILRNLEASDISDGILLVIAVTAMVGLFFAVVGRLNKLVSYIPTLLTTLGIFGTFVGIAIGLINFDHADIEKSIGGLLSGMQTAFLTSLVGMGASIVFKIIMSTVIDPLHWLISKIPLFRLVLPRKNEVVTEGIGIEDMYVSMTQQLECLRSIEAQATSQGQAEILEQLREMNRIVSNSVLDKLDKIHYGLNGTDDTTLSSQLSLLKQSIAGDSDDTLVTQIKNLRLESVDYRRTVQNDLKRSVDYLEVIKTETVKQQFQFSTFSAELKTQLDSLEALLSKSATETVIEALKAVIKDFNNNLTEQFGDNFKQLNQSVDALLIWQENYKEQVKDMTLQYQLGVQSIKATEVSVGAISQEAKVIPESMQKLKSVIEVNQHQIEELHRHLEAFEAVRNRAVEAVPEIQEHIDHTLKSMRKGAEDLSESLVNNSTEISKVLQQGADQFEASVKQTNESLVLSSDNVVKGASDIKQQFVECVGDVQEKMGEVSESLTEGASELGKTLQDANQDLVSDTKQARDESLQSIQSVVSEFSKQSTELQQQSSSAVESLLTSMLEESESIATTLKDANQDLVNDTKQARDESLQSIQSVVSEFSKQSAELQQQSSSAVESLLTSMLEESEGMATTLQRANQELADGTQQARQQTLRTIEESNQRLVQQAQQTHEKLSQQVTALLDRQLKETDKTFKALENEVEKRVSLSAEAVNKSLEMIERSMEKELNRVMGEMGRALTTITKGFTNDYVKLVNEMERVVRRRG